ncbi:MAG: substrate-binding domain-containing protein [Propioniciclava sp.]
MADWAEGADLKLGILELAPGIIAGDDRVNGFLEAIADAPNVEVVSQLVGQTVEDSYQAAQDMLTANPDLGAIYAINGPSAEGASRALEAAGIQVGDDFLLVGFNGDPNEIELIGEGKQTATIAQDPFTQGRLAVENAMGLFDGTQPTYTDADERTILVPVSVVDAANLEEFKAEREAQG